MVVTLQETEGLVTRYDFFLILQLIFSRASLERCLSQWGLFRKLSMRRLPVDRECVEEEISRGFWNSKNDAVIAQYVELNLGINLR
jgi:hypothetical protein